MSSRPERGGPTTQAGIYFQNCITVLRLSEMLEVGSLPNMVSRRVISVRSEAPVEVDDTVVEWSDGRKEYIQAKISVSLGGEAWNTLWRHFYQQYSDPNFKSSTGDDVITLAIRWTPQMSHLASSLMRASTSQTANEWSERLTAPQQRIFQEIQALLNVDDEVLFEFCSSVQVWLIYFENDPMETNTFEREVTKTLTATLDSTENIFSVLMDHVGNNSRVRGAWQYDQLVEFLQKKGYQVKGKTNSVSPSNFQPLYPNPYIVGPPLRSPQSPFYGRDSLIDDVVWRIGRHAKDGMAPNALLLYGPHRSGKSSVLFQLSHRIGPEFKPLYVDLSGISLAMELPRVLEAIMNELENTLLTEGLNTTVPPYPEIKNKPGNSMTVYMRQVIKACLPQRPIIMLDESDTLSSVAEDVEVTQSLLLFMRTVIERTRGAFFVFASCRDIDGFTEPGMSRLLAVMDDHIRVELLSEPEAAKLILEPVSDYFTYDQETLSAFLELSGRYPCFVQLICRQAVDWRNKNKETHISVEAVEEIVTEAVSRGHQQFADLWIGLSHGERGILYALSMIKVDETPLTIVSIKSHADMLQLIISDWHVALNRLIRKGFVTENKGVIDLPFGLLRRWICCSPFEDLFQPISYTNSNVLVN